MGGYATRAIPNIANLRGKTCGRIKMNRDRNWGEETHFIASLIHNLDKQRILYLDSLFL